MKLMNFNRFPLRLLFFLSLFILANQQLAWGQTNEIWLLRFTGPIGPVSAKYIVTGIEKAQKEKAQCVILVMDTPGGLDESMREIVKAILNASTPIVSFVYPSGARAASA
ncbi:MAG: nodulation protein NfeD, partial [candidate division WOR-3 bacterium]